MSEGCRPVEVDGEIIRVQGNREMDEKEKLMFAELVRAAKRKFQNESGQKEKFGGGRK